MTLYEIDQAIQGLVDPETGELMDYEAFAALQMDRDAKIENMALWYKDLMADAKAIKEEADTLNERRKALENKAERLKSYLTVCDRLGLSALVEAHDEEEIRRALRAGARIIGVNNRNLKDFTVDVENSTRLRELVPDSVLFVAESGIRSSRDIQRLQEAKVNGVLIGETLMRAPDKKRMLDELRGNYDGN